MSAVEEIETAITRLETLKERASSAPWSADVGVRGDCVLWGDRDKFLTNIEHDHRAQPSDQDFPGKQAVMFDVDRNDALLMEVLHRTIDAQLKILRSELAWGDDNQYTLALARAINGEPTT